ncbi:plasmid partitioning protein RepB [Neorhizobium huautlense]|nr:plasmid partitioning protein RepB [Neorhizobium huautlense]
MSRKDILRGAVTSEPLADRPARAKVRPMLGTALPPAETNAATRLTSQVGNAFAESKAKFERAEEIERRLAEGQTVIELDAARIEPSFVQDRMPGDIDGLVASIREQGQQVPILVRPHPEKPGFYQVAFGHRRLRALLELGLPVRAVVRDLTDEQLVVAQGQENNEREDLTFIEKARFAYQLNKQFSRDVVIAALSIDKSNLSKMILLVEALPAEFIDAIGPAPGVGRPSWQQLAELVEKAGSPAGAISLARSDEVQALASVDRFKAVLGGLKPQRGPNKLPQIMATPAGDRLAQVVQSKTKLEISIDRKAAPDFAAFVLEKLPALYLEHQAKNEKKNGE